MHKDIYLTDLIDVSVLQRIQNAFSELTGMAALTTDMTGTPVTEGSNFSHFCMDLVRTTEEGRRYCEWCDKYGAEQTRERGYQTTYYCHAGLIDFAAPITLHGEQIGCFIGGQVLSQKPDLEKMRTVADAIGVDKKELIEAAGKIRILEKGVIDRAAYFLYEIAAVLSDMAYSRYLTEQAEEDMAKAAQMKSDFLANMSHEIRTPMNAVIGMAEMALREELPPSARYYINQIKSSGRELLTIINDILDFSKVESGKMDIVPVEYEAMSIINDVVNVIETRLQDKPVELIVNLRPDVPRLLYGDNIRIKQVLINIANNAAKFTKEGKVTIGLSYNRKAVDLIEMQIYVEDTGIGIKEENLDKIFQSFQQVDSKRNRNIEGTGLGLAISQQLLSLMDGEIKVESEYGKGSKFSLIFPQKVLDNTFSIQLTDAETKAVAGLIANPHVREQLAMDCDILGVFYNDIASPEMLLEYAGKHSGRELFLFIEHDLFTKDWEKFAKDNPEIRFVLLLDFFEDKRYGIPNLMVVKKPVYALNLTTILKGGNLIEVADKDENDNIEFTAPEAEVLIVDDNSINLVVAEGLLKPLQMKIQTAASGQEAIEKVKHNHFDIIFMDHMMPEMDGIETTHVLREMEECKETPIIALSANAIGDIQERFINEGMNDFVAKPIEFHTLIVKVRTWLPAEKIKKGAAEVEAQEANAIPDSIGDLDKENAVNMLGSEQLFFTILENYYKAIDKKAALIRETWESEDIERYTIEVHALKSLSKQIGATALSEMALELEKAGNEKNIAYINENTEPMLEKYLSYLPVLEPLFKKEEDDTEKQDIDKDTLLSFFEKLRAAAEELDMDSMEETAAEMEKYRYGEKQELFDRLKDAVEGMDTEACEEILAEWESAL